MYRDIGGHTTGPAHACDLAMTVMFVRIYLGRKLGLRHMDVYILEFRWTFHLLSLSLDVLSTYDISPRWRFRRE